MRIVQDGPYHVPGSSCTNEEGALVGRGFAFGRTEGNLVATGGSGRSGFRNDFREDIMGHVDQAVHRFKKEYEIQILMPVR